MVLPFLLAAIPLFLPSLIFGLLDGYGFKRFLLGFAGLLASLAASCVLPLFLAQYWPLAIVLAALLALGSWFVAAPGLARRPPRLEASSQPVA